jgi:hypothetical protein
LKLLTILAFVWRECGKPGTEVKIICDPSEIRTKYLLYTDLEDYSYTAFFTMNAYITHTVTVPVTLFNAVVPGGGYKPWIRQSWPTLLH